MATIENGDKLIAAHPDQAEVSAWILADGSRFISDAGNGSTEADDGFTELWLEITGEKI